MAGLTPRYRAGNSGGGVARWVIRNLPSLLGLFMLGWLIFLSTQDLKFRQPVESRVQVIVHTHNHDDGGVPGGRGEFDAGVDEVVEGEEDEESPIEGDDAEPMDEELLEEVGGGERPVLHEDDETEEDGVGEVGVEEVDDAEVARKVDLSLLPGPRKVDPADGAMEEEDELFEGNEAPDGSKIGVIGNTRVVIAGENAKPKNVHSVSIEGGLYGNYGTVDEHDKKNAAKVARVKKDPSAERDMQPAESGVAVGTPKEGPSSPRYKKEWDIQQFISTVSDPRAFLASDFAYPEERMIVTRENYVDIMKERLGARTSRALPASYPYPRTKGKCPDGAPDCPALKRGPPKNFFGTCALVGNSGIMKLQHFGSIIDSHDAVMRVNQGPARGYEDIVGSRTTFRLLNKKWVSMYVTKFEGRGVLIPIESKNCTYLASRTGRGSFEKLAATVKRQRPDITTYWLSQGVQNRAYKMLAAFRNAARKVKNTEYTGGDSPSSGLIALNYLLQVCDRVAVYGLSSERSSSDESSTWPYHYFAFKQFPMLHLDSVQLRAHPHHSFEAEGDLIRLLSKGKRVKYCTDPMIPANKLRRCGWAEPMSTSSFGSSKRKGAA